MKDPLEETLSAEIVIEGLSKIIARHVVSEHDGAYAFTDEEKNWLDAAAFVIKRDTGLIVCTHRDGGYCGECFRKARL